MKKVMVFGTFDIVHMGHIHMFEQAKEYGDELIVVVAQDENVEKLKGIGAFHSTDERMAFLKYISIIDNVVAGDKENPYFVIKTYKPDVIAIGYDQKFFVDGIAQALTDYGLEADIVRLSPYKSHKFKTNKIKKYIERII